MKTSIHGGNEASVEDKVCKGRKTLNAASAVGIKRNGLPMIACNLIFWAVIIPIVTFGSELWILSEQDNENLMRFQRYAGRRIQRFPKRSPSTTSFFGLGWIRLTTYVLIKKLLFIMTLLRTDAQNVIRTIFVSRLNHYIANLEISNANRFKSPTFDLLNACSKLGLLNLVENMADGSTPPYVEKEMVKLRVGTRMEFR